MQNVREEEGSEHPLKCVKAAKIENIHTAGSGAALLLIRVIFLFKIYLSLPLFNFTVCG